MNNDLINHFFWADEKIGSKSWYQIFPADCFGHTRVQISGKIGKYGITPHTFIKDFRSIKSKEITIHINCGGGPSDGGMQINQAIKGHPATVKTVISGICGSAGTLLALAGNVVHMAEDAYFVLHEARPDDGKPHKYANTVNRLLAEFYSMELKVDSDVVYDWLKSER